ncbi:hypothetical protein HOLleu_37416 [Holothuria leucospilota]|uniref:Uncharacterized protein n=1 Tax=Holothuria leucospilota TaxID=206669 RepID=A0A9Q1BDB5_HOLLE|nr:hypothetical protein HOLleu_37416 [Holothuria leucospilota]
MGRSSSPMGLLSSVVSMGSDGILGSSSSGCSTVPSTGYSSIKILLDDTTRVVVVMTVFTDSVWTPESSSFMMVSLVSSTCTCSPECGASSSLLSCSKEVSSSGLLSCSSSGVLSRGSSTWVIAAPSGLSSVSTGSDGVIDSSSPGCSTVSSTGKSSTKTSPEDTTRLVVMTVLTDSVWSPDSSSLTMVFLVSCTCTSSPGWDSSVISCSKGAYSSSCLLPSISSGVSTRGS